MSETKPRPGDLIVVSKEPTCLLRQRKPDGSDDPWGNEKRPERAVARLCAEAAQTRVTVWLTDDERRYIRLLDFRKIPPQGPLPEEREAPGA